jgi:acyl carrier protein
MDRKSVVYELLVKWGDKPLSDIRDTDRMRDDIAMDGDDYGMSFVPALEKRLGFRASDAKWNRVVTVADVLDIVQRYSVIG